MNKSPILEIEPKELKFIFELKKQSSCSVQLTNNTYHYVAYKVKTTSPKKYSVRPNVGVMEPKSSCEFIVTMQAQKTAPEDMMCKDKFLIQSTIVTAETTSEDVTSSLFVKDGSRYIEENKLKVALISTPDSPELSPINGDFKIGLDHEKVQIHRKDGILSPEPMVLKNPEHNMIHEAVQLEDVMELKPELRMGSKTMYDVEKPKEDAGMKVSKDEELSKVKEVEELKPLKNLDLKLSNDLDMNTVKNAEELMPLKNLDLKVSNDLASNTVKDAEELKPQKKLDLKVSKNLDMKTVKNAEELKPYKKLDSKVSENLDIKTVKNAEELKPETEAQLKVLKDLDLNKVNNIEELKPGNEFELEVSKDKELNTVKNAEELNLEKEPGLRVSKSIEEQKLMKAIEEMKLKLDGLESKLIESGVTISKLTEERRLSNQETKILQEKLADLINKGPRKVQVGFPLLYVCMVALICVFLGYRLHS